MIKSIDVHSHTHDYSLTHTRSLTHTHMVTLLWAHQKSTIISSLTHIISHSHTPQLLSPTPEHVKNSINIRRDTASIATTVSKKKKKKKKKATSISAG